MLHEDFQRNLPRIYWLYAAAFFVFLLAMAMLERLGISGGTIGVLFVLFTVATYGVIGWIARAAQPDAFLVARRQVPPVLNGMATASDWFSGAMFVALAGGLYFGGHGYLAFVVGWTGGFVLVNALMAPYLRKSGCYTVPEFFALRYGGEAARFVAVAILVIVSFLYVTAQIGATGTIAARALGIDYPIAVVLGLVAILACSVLGGMRGVTWTQAAQYVVLAIAYIVPVIWMSNVQGFGVLPQFTHGEAVARIAELEPMLGVGTLVPDPATVAALAEEGLKLSTLSVPHSQPGASDSLATWQFFTLALCLMAGTAAMPHLLMRFFTTPSVRGARKSVAWSILFIVALYLTAPALATLTKLQLLDPELATSVIGKPVAEVMALDWVRNWTEAGLLRVVDSSADGIVQINEFFMREEAVVLATPEIAGLPVVLSGLVAAGALAAAMSTANGLLMAIAGAVGHDVYYRMAAPAADTRMRLKVARAVMVVAGLAAAAVVAIAQQSILATIAWTFGFAAAGLFFPLVLGIWWKRVNRQGALAGMVLGFGAAALYLWLIEFGGMAPWWGLDGLRFGIVGMAVSLVATVLVSLLTEEPGEEVRVMVDEMRRPAGEPLIRQGR